MANVLINGISARAGGGRAILSNLLCVIQADRDCEHQFWAVVSDWEEYSSIDCPHLHIIRVPHVLRKRVFLPLFYTAYASRLSRKYSIDVVFNLADLIFPTHIPQIWFFDWSYLVYPDSSVWKRMSPVDMCLRKLKVALIKRRMGRVQLTIAQTQTMASRLTEYCGVRDVVVIPSPVTLETLGSSRSVDFGLPSDSKKLLFLANVAPHKNFEILLPLARLFEQNRSNFAVVTTLDATNRKAVEIISSINAEGLGKYVINVGTVAPKDVPRLFEECDALFLPTLLESYGLPFVEAMHHAKPIFTSDFDFTRDVCGDAARYFDPLDVDSIFACLNSAFLNREELSMMVADGKKCLASLPSWEETYDHYKLCIAKLAQSPSQ